MTFKTKYVKIIVVLEMKRIKIIGIIIFAVIGALLIYNHFNTEEFKNSLPNKISKAYGLDSKTGVKNMQNYLMKLLLKKM